MIMMMKLKNGNFTTINMYLKKKRMSILKNITNKISSGEKKN